MIHMGANKQSMLTIICSIDLTLSQHRISNNAATPGSTAIDLYAFGVT